MIYLNIYDKEDKNKVEKVYTAQGYDLMLGTVEEFMNVIDLDKLNDNTEVAKMIVKGFSKIKYLLHDVFPEATEDELSRTRISDLVETILQIGLSVGESIKELKSGNLKRA